MKMSKKENLPALPEENMLAKLLMADDELDGPLPPALTGNFLPSLRFAWAGSGKDRIYEFYLTGEQEVWLPAGTIIVALLKGRTCTRHTIKGDDGKWTYTFAFQGSEKSGGDYEDMVTGAYIEEHGGKVSKGAGYLVAVLVPNGDDFKTVIAEFTPVGTLYGSLFPWLEEGVLKNKKGTALESSTFTKGVTTNKSGNIGANRGKFAALLSTRALTKDHLVAIMEASKPVNEAIARWSEQ